MITCFLIFYSFCLANIGSAQYVIPFNNFCVLHVINSIYSSEFIENKMIKMMEHDLSTNLVQVKNSTCDMFTVFLSVTLKKLLILLLTACVDILKFIFFGFQHLKDSDLILNKSKMLNL